MSWHWCDVFLNNITIMLYVYTPAAVGLNIFYSEEMDWAWHTMQQCPL